MSSMLGGQPRRSPGGATVKLRAAWTVPLPPLSSLSRLPQENPLETVTSKPVRSAEHLRCALANDRAGCLGVACGHSRHDGAVGDAQGVDPVNLQ